METLAPPAYDLERIPRDPPLDAPLEEHIKVTLHRIAICLRNVSSHTGREELFCNADQHLIHGEIERIRVLQPGLRNAIHDLLLAGNTSAIPMVISAFTADVDRSIAAVYEEEQKEEDTFRKGFYVVLQVVNDYCEKIERLIDQANL